MKTKKLRLKLALNKETVSKLHNLEMLGIQGGYDTLGGCTEELCQPTDDGLKTCVGPQTQCIEIC